MDSFLKYEKCFYKEFLKCKNVLNIKGITLMRNGVYLKTMRIIYLVRLC